MMNKQFCFRCKKRWYSKKKFVRWCPYCGNSMKNKLFNGTHFKERIANRIINKGVEQKK